MQLKPRATAMTHEGVSMPRIEYRWYHHLLHDSCCYLIVGGWSLAEKAFLSDLSPFVVLGYTTLSVLRTYLVARFMGTNTGIRVGYDSVNEGRGTYKYRYPP